MVVAWTARDGLDADGGDRDEYWVWVCLCGERSLQNKLGYDLIALFSKTFSLLRWKHTNDESESNENEMGKENWRKKNKQNKDIINTTLLFIYV